MNFAKEARKLANFITSLDKFQTYPVSDMTCYNHVGALFTDVVLQAGLNYNSVVKPRVHRVLIHYSDAYTVQRFRSVIDEEGLSNVIKWNHPTKLDRMHRLLGYAAENCLNTSADLKRHFIKPLNQQQLLEINGFGPKTLDYFLKLLNFDTVAVDRHIYSFIELAEVPVNGYQPTKKVVEFAADLLEISRSSIDYSIWKYMSGKEREVNECCDQLTFSF